MRKQHAMFGLKKGIFDTFFKGELLKKTFHPHYLSFWSLFIFMLFLNDTWYTLVQISAPSDFIPIDVRFFCWFKFILINFSNIFFSRFIRFAVFKNILILCQRNSVFFKSFMEKKLHFCTFLKRLPMNGFSYCTYVCHFVSFKIIHLEI